MASEIKFAKITNSGKLQDRFLTCQYAQSEDLSRSGMGEIFSIVEILSPWFPTAQIGQLIINNFNKHYYQGGSTSDLVNFEESLKGVNESLALATQDGETDWIGKLNAILAVVVGSSLHIAPTGKIDAYIFRDGKVNQLTEGMAGTVEVHPLKTFSNVISGELKPHDKVLLTSSDLLNYLSLESIQQLVAFNNPSVAASQIAKLLRKARGRNVNLVIIGLYSKDEISAEPATGELETTYYLDKSSDSIFHRLKNLWHNILAPILKMTGSSLAKLTTKSFNDASTKFKNLREKKPAEANEVKSQALPPSTTPSAPSPPAEPKEDHFHREFLKDTPRDDTLLKDEQINFSPEYIHYYNENKKPKESYLSKLFPKILGAMARFYRFVIALAQDRNRRKYLYIAGAVVLILIIALFTLFHGKGTKVGNIQAQNILDQALSAEKDGKNSLANGNQDQAKTQFSDAISKAQSILGNTFVAKDANQVITDSYSQLDKLTATTRFTSLNALSTSPTETNNFYVLNGEIYFIGPTTIYQGSVLGGTPEKVAALPSGKGSIIASTQASQILYLYTNNQYMFSFDATNNQLNQILVSGGKWETANALSYYVGSLYLLDGVLGQIYKHTSTQNTFAAGQAYLTSNTSTVKQSLSMAIDGSIYVLKSTGDVIEFQHSKLQDFKLTGLPTPADQLAKPIKIYTDSDTPALYILDNSQKRIVEFDKNGNFIHQYALPERFNDIKDFDISIKSRKIWVLQKNSVYELNI